MCPSATACMLHIRNAQQIFEIISTLSYAIELSMHLCLLKLSFCLKTLWIYLACDQAASEQIGTLVSFTRCPQVPSTVLGAVAITNKWHGPCLQGIDNPVVGDEARIHIPLSAVSLSTVAVTRGQLRFKSVTHNKIF